VEFDGALTDEFFHCSSLNDLIFRLNEIDGKSFNTWRPACEYQWLQIDKIFICSLLSGIQLFSHLKFSLQLPLSTDFFSFWYIDK